MPKENGTEPVQGLWMLSAAQNNVKNGKMPNREVEVIKNIQWIFFGKLKCTLYICQKFSFGFLGYISASHSVRIEALFVSL